MTHRFYPSDVLLAISWAQREIQRPDSNLNALLSRHALGSLAELFNSDALTDSVDELFDGLQQYPWQTIVDRNEVFEFAPVGCVVLDDLRAGNTLRGLWYGWLTGNDVAIRSANAQFWRNLVEILRQPGFPLPAFRATEPEVVVAGMQVTVPDVVIACDSGNNELEPVPNTRDATLFGETLDRNNAIAVIAPDGASLDSLASLLVVDVRADWVHELFHRRYRPGVNLAAARNATDEPSRRARLDARIRYLVHAARRTTHYRDLPEVYTFSDLQQLPFLDKETLETRSLPRSRDMCSDARPSGEVLRSGGTSGAPRYVVYSRRDWNNMIREAIPLFYSLGVAPGDRMINTLYGGGMYGGMITTVCEFSRMPIECYTTGQVLSVNDLLMLVTRFNANIILGVPSLILPLLREAKERMPSLTIDKIIYGGVPMAEVDKIWLRKELGTKVISSILAANDGAQIGYQCGHLDGGLHHLCDDFNLVEIVDDEGKVLADGETGNMAITCMQKTEGPLIRYLIGDVGRIVHMNCACGMKGRVLDYLGRSDGHVKFFRRAIYHHDVLEALATFQVSQLQLEIVTKNHKECLIAHLESPAQLDAAEVKSFLENRFTALGGASQFDQSVDAFEFTVKCFPEGALARNAVSGKIKPVVDHRVGQ